MAGADAIQPSQSQAADSNFKKQLFAMMFPPITKRKKKKAPRNDSRNNAVQALHQVNTA